MENRLPFSGPFFLQLSYLVLQWKRVARTGVMDGKIDLISSHLRSSAKICGQNPSDL